MTSPGLLILSGVRGDTRRYRSVHLAEQATMAGLQVTLAHAWQCGLPGLIKQNRFNFAVFQRVEMDRFIQRLVDGLKNQGTIILYDTDDLVFDRDAFKYIDSPDFSDPLRAKLYLRSMERQKEMLLAADGVLVSTHYMVKQVRRLNKPVWVHQNALSQEMICLSEDAYQARKSHNEIIMGYASGTRTHDRDFAVAASALRQILVQYPQTELWLIGDVDPGEGWEGFGDRVRRIPKLKWRQLPGYLAQLDINLAPLVAGNPFAESKSAIKYMEAALVRCPTIASACAEFKEVICDGENGFLAHNDKEWLGKLTLLVENTQLRDEMGKQAYQGVMDIAHPNRRSSDLLNTLHEISMELRGSSPLADFYAKQQISDPKEAIDLPYKWKEAPGDMQRGWATLWRRGPLELFGGIWVGIRRLLAPLFPFRKHKMNNN